VREPNPVASVDAPPAGPVTKNGHTTPQAPQDLQSADGAMSAPAVRTPHAALPELTPTPHAPIKFAPIVLVLVEMLLDAVAI